MNGGQNLSETNADKSVGTRLDWQPRPSLSFGSGTFVWNEQPDSLPARQRLFNQITARWLPGRWELTATLDAGRQRLVQAGSDWWTDSAFVARRALTGQVKVVGRVEHLYDRGKQSSRGRSDTDRRRLVWRKRHGVLTFSGRTSPARRLGVRSRPRGVQCHARPPSAARRRVGARCQCVQRVRRDAGCEHHGAWCASLLRGMSIRTDAAACGARRPSDCSCAYRKQFSSSGRDRLFVA
jgi:hypothetical protein